MTTRQQLVQITLSCIGAQSLSSCTKQESYRVTSIYIVSMVHRIEVGLEVMSARTYSLLVHMSNDVQPKVIICATMKGPRIED